jgi:hypothetical protein
LASPHAPFASSKAEPVAVLQLGTGNAANSQPIRSRAVDFRLCVRKLFTMMELRARSWMACGGWIAILTALLISAALSAETEIQILIALSSAYAIQGCLAELIGVKIDSSGISFPNRVLPTFPYLVLFRRKLRKGSFDRIDFIDKQRIIIYPERRQIIVPTTKKSEDSFVTILRKTFPRVRVANIY